MKCFMCRKPFDEASEFLEVFYGNEHDIVNMCADCAKDYPKVYEQNTNCYRYTCLGCGKQYDTYNKVDDEYNRFCDNCDMLTNISEAVSHPSHYNKGKYEVIDVIDDWKLNFNTGNAVKYIARAEHKGKQIEDLQKAIFYLNYEIERLSKND